MKCACDSPNSIGRMQAKAGSARTFNLDYFGDYLSLGSVDDYFKGIGDCIEHSISECGVVLARDVRSGTLPGTANWNDTVSSGLSSTLGFVTV